jgi:hypothetical protein
VAGHVDRAHAAAAQVPVRAIGIADRVGARHVREFTPDLGQHRLDRLRRQAIVAHQALPTARSVDVALVRVHRRLRQAVQPGHVVFVYVAQHHQIGIVQFRADAVGDQRRVEGRASVGAAYDHLVAIGILARLLAEEDADAAEVDAANGIDHERKYAGFFGAEILAA